MPAWVGRMAILKLNRSTKPHAREGMGLKAFKMAAMSSDSPLTPLDPFKGIGSGGAWIPNNPHSERLRVYHFHRASDDTLVARVWFGAGTEGPPGHAHGGSIASVLDEAMGAAAWHAGHRVIAARITVDFRKMVPIGMTATIEARVEAIHGRKIHTRARMTDAEGALCASSEGLFIVLKPEQLARLTNFNE